MSRRGKQSQRIQEKAGSPVPNLDPGFLMPPIAQGNLIGGRGIYSQSVLVYSALRMRIKQYESARMAFFARGEDSIDPIKMADSDPVARLFRTPNSIMDGAGFWQLLQAYLLCHGGYIVVMFRNGKLINPGEIPDTMIPFPLAGWKRIRPAGTMNLSAFATEGWENSQLNNLRVENHQCVVKMDPDPSGRFELIAAAGIALDPATTQMRVDNYASTILDNNARPGLVISTEADMQDDDRRNFQAQWASKYGGTYNAGKPAVLSGGKWNINTIAPLSIKDIVSAQQFREACWQVFMALGVPELLLGITESSNKASAATVRASYLTETVIPAFRSDERTWESQFFERCGLKYRLAFLEYTLPSFADLMDTRLDTVTKMLAAGVPRNEAFRRVGIPIDSQKWGETTAYIPNTLQLADPAARKEDRASEQPPAPPGKAPDEPPAKVEPAKEEPPKSKPKSAAKSALVALKAHGDKQRRIIAAQAWEKCVTPFEAPIAQTTTKSMKRWKGHFLKRLNSFLKTGKHMDEESRAAKDISVVIEWKASEDPFLPSPSDFNQMFPSEGEAVSDLQNRWRAIFGDVQTATEEQMGKELGAIDSWFSLPPEQHRAVALGRLGDAIQVDDTVRRQLQSVLTAELSRQPMPQPVQIAQALRTEAGHVFDKAFARANTIARTEVGAVMGDYRAKIMKAEGVTLKRWSSMHDSHTRPTHSQAEADGAIKMDEPFSNGLQRPHDPSGDASEVINCRCVIVAG
jgi:hypothetical protein